MSAALHLAKPDDLDRLLALVAAFHAETGLECSDEGRRRGILPLLEGIPHGVAYLIGPSRAPMGYVIVTFGWSVEHGGMDGFIDEIFLRSAVRGRGIAGEVLIALPKALEKAGVKALHLVVDQSNDAANRLYARSGFVLREQFRLMTRTL